MKSQGSRNNITQYNFLIVKNKILIFAPFFGLEQVFHGEKHHAKTSGISYNVFFGNKTRILTLGKGHVQTDYHPKSNSYTFNTGLTPEFDSL